MYPIFSVFGLIIGICVILLLGRNNHPTVPGVGEGLSFFVCLFAFAGFILDIGIQLHIYLTLNENICWNA